MPDDDEPRVPRIPPAPPVPRGAPTLLTIGSTLDALNGQVKGLRQQVADLDKLIKEGPPEVLRISPLPTPSLLSPPPAAPRPSLAVKAAQKTNKWGTRGLALLGALGVIGQIISLWQPQYAGPIADMLKLFAAFIGG